MAGSYSSARKQVIDSLRRNSVLIVNRHAQGIYNASQKNVPQVSESLGYATDALKKSGHVLLAGAEGARRNQNAYDLAISDAIYAREANRDKTKIPDLVEPLTKADFLPAYPLNTTPGIASAAVYYPIRHAMALEMGYTLRGVTHPQAFFLMRAMEERWAELLKDAQKMLELLGQYEAAPFKVKLSPQQKEMQARAREMRAFNAQFRRENGDLGKYGPFESYAEMLEFSGETRKRGKGETIGEAAERVRNAAMVAWENADGVRSRKRG